MRPRTSHLKLACFGTKSRMWYVGLTSHALLGACKGDEHSMGMPFLLLYGPYIPPTHRCFRTHIEAGIYKAK